MCASKGVAAGGEAELEIDSTAPDKVRFLCSDHRSETAASKQPEELDKTGLFFLLFVFSYIGILILCQNNR